jgi:hypothetical protein
VLNIGPNVTIRMAIEPQDARKCIDGLAGVVPISLGRLEGAAVLMGLCACVKRHGLNPWIYLTDVLTQLAAIPGDAASLLPDAWAKHNSLDRT